MCHFIKAEKIASFLDNLISHFTAFPATRTYLVLQVFVFFLQVVDYAREDMELRFFL